MKCQCCNKNRKSPRNAVVRTEQNNFILCGICSNAIHISKNIIFGIMNKNVDWDFLMTSTKKDFEKGFIK